MDGEADMDRQIIYYLPAVRSTRPARFDALLHAAMMVVASR